jgi:N-methylhydantoinase A
VATVGFRLETGDLTRLEAEFCRLQAEALALVSDTGVETGGALVARLADGRFVGQGFDLVVPLPDGPYDRGEAASVRTQLAAAFETAYREKFARTPPKVAIEFVSIRVSVTAAVADTAVVSGFSETGRSAPEGHRRVRIEDGGAGGEAIEVAVYARAALRPGTRFNGPSRGRKLDARHSLARNGRSPAIGLDRGDAGLKREARHAAGFPAGRTRLSIGIAWPGRSGAGEAWAAA